MTHIPKAVCGPCKQEMVIDKNHIILEMLRSNDQPYYKVMADQYICKCCGFTIITGFGRDPFVEHFMDHYDNVQATMQGRFSN